jgi:hypothetical protein
LTKKFYIVVSETKEVIAMSAGKRQLAIIVVFAAVVALATYFL